MHCRHFDSYHYSSWADAEKTAAEIEVEINICIHALGKEGEELQCVLHYFHLILICNDKVDLRYYNWNYNYNLPHFVCVLVSGYSPAYQ